ncbi:MAG: hypothetical protein IPN83_04150 [Holophagales bacterium]|nr:hypothetical protein [Holophagales bacterium]
MDDVLPLESSVEVIDFKGDMRNGADEFVNGAVFLEPHPLDAVGTGAEADDEEPNCLGWVSPGWATVVGMPTWWYRHPS